uniref:HTH_48 domain-containing protein n=1 Tax=Caenorhabditis japonica TaxID=281687 RepID=A0A8R1IAK1_CAEJA
MAESLKKDKHALRGSFLYEFLQGNSAADTHRKINHVIGADTFHYGTVKFWMETLILKKMRSLDDHAWNVREVAPSLGLRKDAVHLRLHQSRSEPKFGQLVPHDLTYQQKNIRCDLALSLLPSNCKRNYDLIGEIVTVDEKWCVMVNRKRQLGTNGLPLLRERHRAVAHTLGVCGGPQQ